MLITIQFDDHDLANVDPAFHALFKAGLRVNFGVAALGLPEAEHSQLPPTSQWDVTNSEAPATPPAGADPSPAKRGRRKKGEAAPAPPITAEPPQAAFQAPGFPNAIPGPVLPVQQPLYTPPAGGQPGVRTFPPAPDPVSSTSVAVDLTTNQQFNPFTAGAPTAAFAPQPAAFPVPQPVPQAVPVQQPAPQFNAANVRGFVIQLVNSPATGARESVQDAIAMAGMSNLSQLTDANAPVLYNALQASLHARGVRLG
jgi:hypothetical protein